MNYTSDPSNRLFQADFIYGGIGPPRSWRTLANVITGIMVRNTVMVVVTGYGKVLILLVTIKARRL